MRHVVAGSRLPIATPCASASHLSFPLRKQRPRRWRACPPRSLEDRSPIDASTTTTSASSSSSSSTSSSPPPPPSPSSSSWRTCRHCKQRFDPSSNPASACRRHPALFTGGEVSKAIGFCREGQGREHWLDEVVGASGLLRFYDCCGASSEDAPGCVVGPHEGF